MKTLTAFRRKTPILPLLLTVMGLVVTQNKTVAQLPDCAGTVMYGLWNDSTGSSAATASQIRAINYVTGAVGPQLGGPYLIQTSTGNPPTFYGSAGLGLDPINRHFFVITQMSNGSGRRKDIYDINTVTGTMTRIHTTPTTVNANIPVVLSDYHFVKLAISPGGIGYAVGVIRDTNLVGTNQSNPLISFTTCGGVPVAGCSVVRLLGFLTDVNPLARDWKLFNGDIAFDNAGNLYFLTVAFDRVSGNARYTDARLLRINAANIPLVSGTGLIPLTVMAEYDGLDSTVVNGIAFNMLGEMFFSTRTFNGPQNPSPAPTFNNVIMRSTVPGTVTPLAGFTNPTAGFSMADLASCNYPNGVLSNVKLVLNGWNEAGTAKLKWDVNMNNQVEYYELQASADGNSFETIARIDPSNTSSANAMYSYTDTKAGDKIKYYRVREIMPGGTKYYSNVIKINFGSKLQLVSKPNPNPFNSKFDLRLELKSASAVNIKLRSQNGSLVYQRNLNGGTGDNRLTIDGLSNLSKGIYIVEITVDDEVIREKLIKQ